MEPMPFVDRVVRLTVADPDGCWLWQGGLKGPVDRPYGAVKYKGRSWLAHRLAYTLSIGPIPDGMQLDHLCRTRLCFNPRHLEPVTGWENRQRGTSPPAVNAVATHCKRGHPLIGNNLYVYARNGIVSRACQECRRDAGRRGDAKRADRWRDPARAAYIREYKRKRRAHASRG